jgi:hypothetical protein
MKADCSRSYLFAMPHVAKQMPHLIALHAACNTLAHVSYTLCSPLAAALTYRSQYLTPCDTDGYYHPNSWMKILSEVALESSRLTR